MQTTRVLSVLTTVVASAFAHAASAQSCTPRAVPHRIPDILSKVYAIELFDDDADGSPSIIAGGEPVSAHQTTNIGTVVKLTNANRWERLGNAIPNCRALAVHGGSLYAATTNGAFRLASGTWTPVGPTSTRYTSLNSIDLGAGPILVGSTTTAVVQINADATWSYLGTPFNCKVNQVVKCDMDGPGPEPVGLFAATSACGNPTTNLRALNGTAWQSCLPATNTWSKTCITVNVNGTDQVLVAAPSGSIGPFQNTKLAMWSPSGWTPVPMNNTLDTHLLSLVAFQEQPGQPKVIWAQGDWIIHRIVNGVAQTFEQFRVNGVGDFTPVTPLVIAATGTAPEKLLLHGAAQASLTRLRFRMYAGCPLSTSDYDSNGIVQVADVFDFLDYWFAQSEFGDFDGNDALEPADIFAFLNAWFAGT